jgi:copper chaperone
MTRGGEMSDTRTYSVPGIHCGHCAAAIKDEVSSVGGVEGIDVDLHAKVVTIRGHALVDEALREAIAEAGYEVAA